jgi:hypothetical protein
MVLFIRRCSLLSPGNVFMNMQIQIQIYLNDTKARYALTGIIKQLTYATENDS